MPATLSSSNFFEVESFRRSLKINFDFRLPGTDILEEFLSQLAREIETAERPNARRVQIRKTKDALDCLLANLLRAEQADPRAFLSISFRTDDYTTTPYNTPPAGDTVFRRIVRYLLHTDPPMVVRKRGYRYSNVAHSTRLRATPRLRSKLRGVLTGSEASTSPLIFHIRQVIGSELIRLKDSNKRLILYEDTDEVISMRQRLKAWNKFISLYWADLAIRDDESLGYLTSSLPEDQADEERERISQRDGLKLPDLTACQLYRVFNNGSFERGGRFYGGWWQKIPKEWRKKILIDGHQTNEVDFSGMLIRMLYHLQGREAEGDPYHLQNVSRDYRPIIKKTLISLINTDQEGAIKAPPRRALPMPWRDFKELIKAHHQPISCYFSSGEGLRMQRIDSDIVDYVIIEAGKRGIPVLPVHDSFIAWDTKTEEIKELMKDAYRSIMGGEIPVDVALSFIEEELEEQPPIPEGADMEELDPDEALDIHLSDQAYSKLWAREAAYRAFYGEEFLQRQVGTYYGPPESRRLFDGVPPPIYSWRQR